MSLSGIVKGGLGRLMAEIQLNTCRRWILG
jgi:hypothetical protein